MPAASFLQTSFLGGLWGPYAQGRMDRPDYRSAMNESLNGLPIEQGSHTRRPGTRFVAHTRTGGPGTLREFHFSQAHSYNMEFTDAHLRFISGTQLVLESTQHAVIGISADTPAIVRTADEHEYVTGEQVMFVTEDAAITVGLGSLLLRQFTVTSTGDETFTLTDPVTGDDIDGSLFDLTGVTLAVSRILDFTTPYPAGTWADLRAVQTGKEVLLCNGAYQPYVLTNLTDEDAANKEFANFSFAPADFHDGPFFDPVGDGSTMTPSALTGVVQLTISFVSWDAGTTYALGDAIAYSGNGYRSLSDDNTNNQPDVSLGFWEVQSPAAGVGADGFQTTDIGRQIRLFSEPQDWDEATAYAVGDKVKFDNGYWSALKATTNKQPDLDAVNWAIDTTAAKWTWGRILSITSPDEVEFQVIGGALLYTDPIKVFRLGLYSNTTGWPTGGTYHEGRFWLFGAQGNRIDSSMSNRPFTFSPTLPDGTVTDANGISAVLEASDVNTIFWASPDSNGILLGTQGGEWLLQASALNDPLTATSIQAKRPTKYGCAPVEPRRTGLSLIVVQRFGKNLMEMVADASTGRYSGQNVAWPAKQLTFTGIEEIAYQQELTPVIWARMGDGSLAGMTYKRESPFGTQPAQFAGWHRHVLGSGRLVTAISAGPSVGGDTDSVTMITNDPATDVHNIELLTSLFEQDTDIINAWFVDDGRPPVASELIEGSPDIVRLYGYDYLAGETVAVWAGGLDLGDLLVSATGTIDVPINVTGSLFTEAYLATLTAAGGFPEAAVYVNRAPTGAIPEPIQNGIFEYDRTLAPVTDTIQDDVLIPDYDNGRAVFLASGKDADDGLVAFNLSTGIETAAKAAPDILPAAAPTEAFVQSPISHTPNGYVYFYSSSSNSGILRKVNSSTLTLAASFGANSASFTTNATRLAAPYHLSGHTVGDHFVISNSSLYSNLGGSEVAVINGDTMAWTGFSAILDEDRSVSVRGPNLSYGSYAAGITYILGKSADAQATYKDIGLYSLMIDQRAQDATDGTGIALTSIAKISPSDIDPSWTHFTSGGIRGLAYDATDGNVILSAHIAVPTLWTAGAFDVWEAKLGSDGNVWGKLLGTSITADPAAPLWLVGTTYAANAYVRGSNSHWYKSIGAGNIGNNPVSSPGQWTDLGIVWVNLGVAGPYTHDQYYVKLNATTGEVMWTVPVAGSVSSTGDDNLHLNRITLGRLAVFSPSAIAGVFQLYFIDTIAGTATIIPVPGVQLTGGQVYDDSTGLMLAHVVYNSGTSGAPTPVDPPTAGSFISAWAGFPGEGGIVPTTPYLAPIIAGYAYNTRGQIVRPIAPQEAGTANGPALGKTRRAHQFTALIHRTQGTYFGTDFNHMRPGRFETPGGTPYTALQLYSGAHWDTVDDDNSFDGMIAWEVRRPYPMTILAVETFLHGNDR